jgi:hypothetical protein
MLWPRPSLCASYGGVAVRTTDHPVRRTGTSVSLDRAFGDDDNIHVKA